MRDAVTVVTVLSLCASQSRFIKAKICRIAQPPPLDCFSEERHLQTPNIGRMKTAPNPCLFSFKCKMRQCSEFKVMTHESWIRTFFGVMNESSVMFLERVDDSWSHVTNLFSFQCKMRFSRFKTGMKTTADSALFPGFCS